MQQIVYTTIPAVVYWEIISCGNASMAILWTHPIIMEGGGGVGCLNKWFFIKKSMRVFPPYRGFFLYVESLVSTFGNLFFSFWGQLSPLSLSYTNADKINEMKRC